MKHETRHSNLDKFSSKQALFYTPSSLEGSKFVVNFSLSFE